MSSNLAIEVQQAYETQIRSFFADESQADAQEQLLLQHAWPLESFAMPSLQEASNRAGMPQPVLESYDYYAANVMEQDWGTVHSVTLLVGENITFSIYVETDGSDGWLEIYDIEGKLLGAARTALGDVTWGDQGEIRSQVQHA